MSLLPDLATPSMPNLPIMMDRRAYEDTCRLIVDFGEEAALEAGERAHAARTIGNHIHYCHWRGVERMVLLLSIDQCLGTVH